jgi:putative transposase
MYQTRAFLYKRKKDNQLEFDFLFEKCKTAKALYNTMLWHYLNWYDIYEERLSQYDVSYILRHSENQRFVSEFADACFDASIAVYYGGIEAFMKAITDWYKHPEKYQGKPRLPKFIRKERSYYHFAQRRMKLSGRYLCPAKSKLEIEIPISVFPDELIGVKELQQVRFYPLSTRCIRIEIVYEIPDHNPQYFGYTMAIDIGVDNLAVCVSDAPNFQPIIFNGKICKSINQWYNKQRSLLSVKRDKGCNPEEKGGNKPDTKLMRQITIKREHRFKWYFHNISTRIISICKEYQINCIIFGHNSLWKTESNIGKRNNQNFVQIPFQLLYDQCQYKAQREGWICEQIEESYTSTIDHLALEPLISIQTHGKKKDAKMNGHVFLGKRINRGLFQSSIGKVINADVNGAIGILRRATDDGCMKEILQNKMIFNPKRISVQGDFLGDYKKVARKEILPISEIEVKIE